MLDLFRYRVVQSEFNHLPANDRQAPNSNYSTSIRKSRPKPLVLIIGRDNDTRFLFKTAFEMWNYDVADAGTLEQALRVSAFRIPDLVLMDTEFDFQASLATLKDLQSSNLFKDCGFVLVSGHAQENIRNTALRAGADLFLVKPIDFEILKKILWIYFKERKLEIS